MSDIGRETEGDGGKQIALIVYVLYFVGFFTGLTAVAGVILAHIKSADASSIYRTHFTYQIRTFWFGLLTLAVGSILTLILVGYLILAWFVVWTLVRCIKGILRLTEGRAITDPATLLW